MTRTFKLAALATLLLGVGLVAVVAWRPSPPPDTPAPGPDPDPEVAALAVGAPPAQAEALRDGVVGRQEYEAAFEATARCLRQVRGVQVDGVVADPGDPRFLALGYTVESGDAADLRGQERRAEAAYRSCAGQFQDYVAYAYQKGVLLSDQERAALRPEVEACLSAHGVKVSAAGSGEEFLRRLKGQPLDRIRPCVRRNPDFFRAPSLPGGSTGDADEHDH